jgi:uncharacterized cupin superfamily protein
MTRDKNIINVNDLDWQSGGNGDKFVFQRKWFTSSTGAQKLGCSLYRVPPGKTAFPYHKHFTNEEAIYVLAGKGTMRLDDEEFQVGPGDYIALPPEGPNHQLINNGSDDLEYLCLSTMIHPDITLFPDSDKVIAFAGSGPGGDKSTRTFFGIYKSDSAVGYYDGE